VGCLWFILRKAIKGDIYITGAGILKIVTLKSGAPLCNLTSSISKYCCPDDALTLGNKAKNRNQLMSFSWYLRNFLV